MVGNREMIERARKPMVWQKNNLVQSMIVDLNGYEIFAMDSEDKILSKHIAHLSNL